MDVNGFDPQTEVMTEETCPSCGWPTAETYTIISRHATSEGVVVYSRCACGRLRATLYATAANAALRATAGVPTPADPTACPTC